MKKQLSITFLLTLLSSITFGQDKYFGYPYQISFSSYFQDSSKIIGGAGTNFKIWDTETGKVLKEVDLKDQYKEVDYEGETYESYGGIGFPKLNRDQSVISFLGNTYGSKQNVRNEIKTLMIFYDLKTDKHRFITGDKDDEFQKITFHPTNDKILGVIAQNSEGLYYYACLFDTEEKKITKKYLVGKGALFPLFIDFSSDGKLTYISYGNSSYNGGIEIYDTESEKLIKKITLKDHPKRFFEWNDQLIAAGHTNTYFFEKDTWKLLHTEKKMSIESIDTVNNLAVGSESFQGDSKVGEVIVFDLEQKTSNTIRVEKSTWSDICHGCHQFISSYNKNFNNPEEKTLSTPSIIRTKLK